MASKRVSGSADYVIPLVVIGGLGVGLYFLFKQFFGTGTGTGTNNAVQDKNVSDAAAAAFANSSRSVAQSMTDTQLNSIIGKMISDAEANTSIFSGSSYQQDIITQMGKLVNTTDLYRLIQLWGTRNVAGASGSICDLIDIDCSAVDLGTFIDSTLSADQLQQLNALLSDNGINYSF